MKRPKTQADSSAATRPESASNARELRKRAGDWLKARRADAGLSQIDLAARLGLKYYTFVSQVENGFSRVPAESLEAWARALGQSPPDFARHLLSYYEPALYRVLFEVKS
jgi:transcriptional regulator with XRE-family HTH domain